MHLTDFFQQAHPLIEQRLSQLFPSDSALNEAARYSIFSGGKRLRPLLVLAAAATFGTPLTRAIDTACALELIHTYSLIHDDLPSMDNDDLRRGKPTLHRVFPEWHALLTGDYLLTYAFEVLANCSSLNASTKLELIRTLAINSGSKGMIGGQMIDLASQGQPIDQATLERMHTWKTAALIACALECGAILSEASDRDRALIKECGIKIGIAFQFADDILDALPASLAESSDQQLQKATAVSFLGSKEAERQMETFLSESLSLLHSLSCPSPLLKTLFITMVHRTH